MTAMVTYFASMLWHARLSNVIFDGLSEQMVGDDYGKPKRQWERVTYRICLAIGSVMLLLLFLGAILGH
jgi:Mn2+/Fe2+ NRAMP family transporter